jgi:hypothetical protein
MGPMIPILNLHRRSPGHGPGEAGTVAPVGDGRALALSPVLSASPQQLASDNALGAQRLDLGVADAEPLAQHLGTVLAQ